MQPIRIGNRLADRCLTKERVGTGRTGSVYQALDTATGDAPVADKLLDTLHPDPVKREFFKRESTALNQLWHPNVVSLQQSGWSDPDECFCPVVDYLPHSPDSYLIGPLEPLAGNFNPFRAISELAGAVAHPHAHDVIHRDIKPSTVLIDETGKLHLADFGIRKLLAHLTPGETIVRYWSDEYASPEQCTSKTASPNSDNYCLGAVFYHTLSGQAPPPEGSPQALVALNCGTVPIQLRNLLKGMLAEGPKEKEYRRPSLVGALEDR